MNHVLKRMRKKLPSLALLASLLLLAVPTVRAQQYYMTLTASYKSTNTAGALLTTKVSASSLLTDIFIDPTVARGHTLVFDVESGEVRVIQKSTGEDLGAWYVFTPDTAIGTLDGTKSEVYWTISCPADSGYEGTAAGTLQITRGLENEITKFKMIGKFTLRYRPESGGSPRVYTGVFTTGAKYTPPVR